jgi:adenine-specific DNA methylase
MIEKDFEVSFVAAIALREKQIQQSYRPVIAVHKWFARRPGTLFRSLLLAEFGHGVLSDIYFQANDLKGLQVADPFMGGGTPLLEANRLGCDVIGYDINPMAYWIVHQESTSLNLHVYREAADQLIAWLENDMKSSPALMEEDAASAAKICDRCCSALKGSFSPLPHSTN